jgi:hypothetical protein
MANPNTPYGLRLAQRVGMADFRDSLSVYYVPANTTNAIYEGDPVIKLAASADVNGIDGVNLATAGTSNKITGVVCGFLGTGTAQLGLTAPSFFGLSGSPGPVYKPANAATPYYLLVSDDPEALYSIQSNDSGGVPAATIVGKNANLASGSGSPYTGWSGYQMAANQVGTSANNQLAIVGVLQEPDNVAGLANCKFLVRINQNTNVNAGAGI